jgi:RHS repeat-associated protein
MDREGKLIQKYINGPSLDEKIAKIESDKRTIYYLQDGLGSVTALTDPKGTLLEHYTYDAYGAVTIESRLGHPHRDYNNRFVFTGREYLKELDLLDCRNRYYSESLGRWLPRDPIAESGGINLYAYCGNEPIDRIDAYGLIVVVLEGYGGSLSPINTEVAAIATATGGKAYPWGDTDSAAKDIRAALKNDPSQPVIIVGYSLSGRCEAC